MKNENCIIDENIKRLLHKKSLLKMCLHAHFDDKMSLIAKENYEKLPELFCASGDFSEFGQTETNEFILKSADILYGYVFNEEKAQMRLLPPKPEKMSNVSVAYFKNPACDEAYEYFAKEFDCCEAEFCTDFSSACESVYTQKCDYCIIPTENSSDGRLSGFHEMISKHELFICATRDVTNADFSLRTLFSLCAPSPLMLLKTGDVCLRICFFSSTSCDLLKIIQGADYFKLNTARTNSVFELYRFEIGKCCFEFEGKIENVLKYLFYLYLTKAEYTLEGIYDKG